MEWVVEVTGKRGDLELLAGDIRGPEPLFAIEDGKLQLRSNRFRPTDDHDSVRRTAAAVLVAAVDAVAAARRQPIAARIGSLVRLHPDGRKDMYISPDPVAIKVTTFPATVTGATPPRETRAEKVLRLASGTRQVATAAHFLNSPSTWVNLYKVYEALREAAGDEPKLSEITGVAKRDLERFRRTADNMSGPAGEEARHAQSIHPPPKRPMGLPEAEDLIWKLFYAYVDSIQ